MYKLKLSILFFVFSLMWMTTVNAAQHLVFGIFPYFDPGYLASLHKPLKDYLSDNINHDVAMRSAANFKAFKKKTTAGDYDILLTAPHLGRIAEKQYGYQWLGFTQNKSHAIFTVKANSKIKTLSDLKGHSITLPPPAAIIHQMALKKLEEAGLEIGKDVTIKVSPSHNNAMLAVINGVTEAAAFGKPTWSRFKPKGRDTLIKLAQSEDIPGFALLTHSRVPPDIHNKLKLALLNYSNTEAGVSYFDSTGLKGIRLAEDEDFILLDKYLTVIKASRTKK